MLSISNLHAEVIARQHKRNAVYDDILQRVISKIKYENTKSDACMCAYTLPNWMFGVPLYNVVACAEYITNRLRESGFMVVYRRPNILYINWQQRPAPAIQAEPTARTKQLSLQDIQASRQIELNPSKTKQSIFDEIDKTFLKSPGQHQQLSSDWRLARPTGQALNLDDVLRALD